LTGYQAGTRFGIGADADGLLRAGVPGVQLTWMDAKVGDHVITPRIGKPVEVQALWINALRIAAAWSPRWAEIAAKAQGSFAARFPDAASGGLFDVVDADHVSERTDARVRPNQVFAVGGLPFALLEGEAARRVVDLVEARLLTPLGLRTLDPADPAYVGHYRGGPAQRDGAYHQGTAWPWLMGPFVAAWLRVRGDTKAAKTEATRRFLPPLLAHLEVAGLGHVSEVVDGDAPHTPGGCPFQAWSLGELIRIRSMLGAA
ncbi:MAG: amylo-alpha-1,6-glucosidase, partial [Acetobacteraceae bacterium]